MRDKTSSIGIIGASGYIGRQLLQRFQQSHIPVRGTYHRQNIPGLIHFDLLRPDFSFLDRPLPLTHLIIASAANASLDKTAEHWEESYATNCLGVKQVLTECFNRGVFPIYFSSDGVFDGKQGNYSEDDVRSPVNKYGHIRKEVEDFLLASQKPFLILRMSRVFDTDGGSTTLTTLLIDLKKDLESCRTLTLATDQWFTPIHIDDLFFFVSGLIEMGKEGVYHLASLPRISRFELAQEIKHFFNLPGSILPGKINSFHFREQRPLDTSLNIEKISTLTGFQRKPLDFFLEKMA